MKMSIKAIYNRYKLFKAIGIQKPLRAAMDKNFWQGGVLFHWD